MRCIDICSDAAVLVSSGRGVTLSYLKKKHLFFLLKKGFLKNKSSPKARVFLFVFCFCFLFFVFYGDVA